MVNFFFNFIATLTLLLAFGVITTSNPVHSILFLIMVFFCSSIIMIFLGAEFIGLLYLIVYVGAVAVLFLFVVMMINIRSIEMRRIRGRYLFNFLFFSILLFGLYVMSYADVFKKLTISPAPAGLEHFTDYVDYYWLSQTIHPLEAFGLALYSLQAINVLLAAFVLLVALMGAIVLSLRSAKNSNLVKQQQISVQSNRDLGHRKIRLID